VSARSRCSWRDPQRSKAFYEEVFDAPVTYEDEDAVTFRFESTLVNLLRTRSARELIDPGGSPVQTRLARPAHDLGVSR
jgi:hypothetical protein